MGGEMLYVLRQRLKAQKIDVDKTIQGKTTLEISSISKILNKYFTNIFVTNNIIYNYTDNFLTSNIF